jgi:hypothetical protein
VSVRAFSVTLLVGTLAELPPPERFGRLFWAYDRGRLLFDTGGRWIGHSLGIALGASVTQRQLLTNMNGAAADAWAPVYDDAPEAVDATDRTEFRIVASWNPRNLASGSAQQLRWSSPAGVLCTLDVPAAALRRMVDSGWLPLPEWAAGQEFELEWQCRSSVATDDPIATGWRLSLR